jgi:nucleoid-associated protein YgaU
MKDKIVKILKDRQSTITSGLAALMIIIGGFLVFSYFSSLERTKAPQITPEATQSSQPNSDQAKRVTTTNQPVSLGTTSPISQPAPQPTHYTVAAGDNLSQIAQKFYGDPNKWVEIAKANNLDNPRIIHAGNALTIPALASTSSQTVAQAPAAAANANSVKPGGSYTVQAGDTLWSIAMKTYGSGYEWYRIDAANSPIARNINDKPIVVVGQVLKIP